MTLRIDFTRDRRSFAADLEGAPAAAPAAADPPAAVDPTPAAPAAPAAAKWWEGDKFADPARQYLTAKGLTVDDPLEAMPRLVDIASNAEKRIGRGIDTIIDKPGKDQPYTDWVAQNRAALGLPADEAAYKIAPPEGWPKDQAWDTAREGKARAIALKYGMPEAALQEMIGLQADSVMEMLGATDAELAKANALMMADLEKDFGTQTPALLAKGKQAAQLVAEKAGLSSEALQNMANTMTDKIGDANVMRFMGALADMMSDDAAVGLGKGGALTTTPAEARAQLAALRAPGGDYYEATNKRDNAAMAKLKPQMEHLTRIAAGG